MESNLHGTMAVVAQPIQAVDEFAGGGESRQLRRLGEGRKRPETMEEEEAPQNEEESEENSPPQESRRPHKERRSTKRH